MRLEFFKAVSYESPTRVCNIEFPVFYFVEDHKMVLIPMQDAGLCLFCQSADICSCAERTEPERLGKVFKA